MIASRQSTFLAGAALAVAMTAAALPASAVQKQDEAAAPTQMSLTEPSVVVFNQKAEGKTIKLSYAYLPKDGYAAIHAADANGKPTGEAIAHVALKAGDHRDIKLTFNAEPKTGATYWVALYTEGGGDGKLDSNDKPLWQVSQLPAENMFTIQ
jgi:opacity protein-like surface antigen